MPIRGLRGPTRRLTLGKGWQLDSACELFLLAFPKGPVTRERAAGGLLSVCVYLHETVFCTELNAGHIRLLAVLEHFPAIKKFGAYV